MISFLSGFESKEERRKFSLLALVFSFTIGVYWLFRPVKDGVFLTMVGIDWQPIVKILSLFVVIPIVLIYSKLVDRFPRHKLLYGLSLFYAVTTIIFAFLILNPVIGIENTEASPWRLLGWSWYLFVESFGSVMVALFWSFVADTTTPDSAKRGYSLIALGGQLGGLVGPLAGGFIADKYGTGNALVFGAAGLVALTVSVWYYMRSMPKSEMHGFTAHGKPLESKPGETKSKPGFTEGLRLLLAKPYLLGILAVVSFYEIIVTILDFQFKALAKAQYTGDALTSYLSEYAVWTNGVALVSLLLGAGALGRKLGLTKTLLLLPILVAAAVITLNLHPILSVAFAVMVISKGINYALNQPAKEQLYIPTSKDSKYKAKAWIDMFGSRSSKGLGSVVTASKGLVTTEMFMIITATASFGMIAVWIFAALFLGRTHAQAVKEDRLVC